MAEVDARKLLAQAKDLSARYARRLGPDEAADLASEALARGLETPPADGRMDPWLERIARNLLVDRWRRARVAASAEIAAPEGLPTPEDLLLAGERRKIVRRSLRRLPREQRRTILQRYYAGGGAVEGISATTVRTRLHRSLARLREMTRGLLALAPPIRLLRILPLALNPAAAVVFLVAQQAPLPIPAAPPAPSAQVQRRPPAHAERTPAPIPPPVAPAPAAKARPARAVANPTIVTAPVTKYEFENDEVEGTLLGPDDDLIHGRIKVRQSSLIEIPGSFVASVAKSIEDL